MAIAGYSAVRFSATGSITQAGSIAVIGGADGPTAIYVAHTVNPLLPIILGGIAVLLLLAMAGAILYRKKHR